MDYAPTENPWLGLYAAQIAAGRSVIEAMASVFKPAPGPAAQSQPRAEFWTSPNQIVRELATMRLRKFAALSAAGDVKTMPALVVAPFALHGASVVDFAPGHSLVEVLAQGCGLEISLTDWRSARRERQFDTIDTLLADLNIAVDDVGGGEPLALLGICQGGWLAAAYTARYPRKVAALALAGAPIDIAAERSVLAEICAATPPEAVEALLRVGDGLLEGRNMLAIWPFPTPMTTIARDILQQETLPEDMACAAENDTLVDRFMRWHATVVDLPGAYYRQTVDWIFRENRLARGRFQALGETIDLRRIVCPLFLLAAENDEIVSPGQLLALRDLVGSPREQIEAHCVPGLHLSLFMGRRTLAGAWPLVGPFVARAYEARRNPARRQRQPYPPPQPERS